MHLHHLNTCIRNVEERIKVGDRIAEIEDTDSRSLTRVLGFSSLKGNSMPWVSQYS